MSIAHRASALLCLALLAGQALTTSAAPRPAPDAARAADARAALARATARMAVGGEARLRALRTLHVEAAGYRNALEQSERPEGPWVVEEIRYVEDRDVAGAKLRRTTSSRMATYEWAQTLVVSDGVVAVESADRQAPFAPGADEWLALGPERVLLTALDAPDLAAAPDAELQSVPHHVLTFTWKSAPVRLFLNASSDLPTAVEITRPTAYDYLGIWGDVTTTVLYSAWQLVPGGLRYPMQWDVRQNGMPASSTFLTKVVPDAAPPEKGFAITEQVSAAFRAAQAHAGEVRLGRPDMPPRDVADGVVEIPGNFNATIVRQPDGVVVVEAPVSSAYSAKVLEEAERRYPGVPVKGVVTTSDAWPHLGGLREYAARGVPIYVLDVNVPIVERLLAAPFRTSPDALARKPRKADLRVVRGRTTIGSGDNRIELYPIRSETGERQMLAYFPGRRALYASDLAQPAGSAGPWAAEYYDEVRSAVERERLDVATLFAMHMTPVPWSDITGVVDRAKAPVGAAQPAAPAAAQ